MLFVCIAVVITITTVRLLWNLDVVMIKEYRNYVICVQDKLSNDIMMQRHAWPTGRLVGMNMTHVNKPAINMTELLELLQMSSLRNRNISHKHMAPSRDIILHFQSVMDEGEKHTLLETLSTLAEVCKKSDFTYMIYSGTLLGSYRHHDIVPWDDDVDILMNYTQREDIMTALSNLAPDYKVKMAGARVKFFSTNGSQTSKYPWKWPYVDISFFKENTTHIWDGSMEDDYGYRDYLYPREIVFPLHKRPLSNMYFDAPRDSFAHLKSTYGLGMLNACFTSHYSHKRENVTDKIYQIPCENLQNVYPFVHRSPVKGGIKETLMLGTDIVHSVIVPEPQYAISQPFKVQLIIS